MGTTCCKCAKPRSEERRSISIKELILSKFQRFKRNRVVPIVIRQSPTGSAHSIRNANESNYVTAVAIVNNREYDEVVEFIPSASCCSVFENDEQELELIDLNSGDDAEDSHTVTLDTRNRKVRPKAAKGERSIVPILPTCVRELDNDVDNLLSVQSDVTVKKVRPKAARGPRTPMTMQVVRVTNGDVALPGEVVPSSEYFSKKQTPSRPQLTVPAMRTAEQKYLDDWMVRQIHAEHASDSDDD